MVRSVFALGWQAGGGVGMRGEEGGRGWGGEQEVVLKGWRAKRTYIRRETSAQVSLKTSLGSLYGGHIEKRGYV